MTMMEVVKAVVVMVMVVVVVVVPVKGQTWGPCEFNATVTTAGVRVECANVSVPLSWAEPTRFTQRIAIHITRIAAAEATTTTQTTTTTTTKTTTTAERHVWMINGGPGDANENTVMSLLRAGAASPQGNIIALMGGNVEMYFPDHRGTGLSVPAMECGDDVMSDVAACVAKLRAEWGTDGMAQFSTTNAVHDVDFLMQQISAGHETHVYGISYGTFFVQRLLLNHTAPITTVTIDGTVIATPAMYRFDVGLHSIGRDWLSLCATDTECAAAFGGVHPFAVTDEMFNAMKRDRAKTCLGQLGKRSNMTLQEIFGEFIQDGQLRQLIPSIVFRMTRCSTVDINALNNFFGRIDAFLALKTGHFAGSRTLALNVIMSEMFGVDEPPSLETVQRWHNESFFVLPAAEDVGVLRAAYDVWPRYQRDSLFGRYPVEAAKTTPMLMLHGDFDPNTPFSWAAVAAKQYAGTKAKLVKLHFAPHGSLTRSPVVGSNVACGLTVFASFVNNKGNGMDTTCVDKLEAPDWMGYSAAMKAVSTTLFGTSNMWEL